MCHGRVHSNGAVPRQAETAPLEFRTVRPRWCRAARASATSAAYVVAADGELDDGGDDAAAARADFPASRMSCFFILL